MAMMQDRLQLSRLQMPLDKWSTREQLCLASAVSSSGDQNWMSVSRTLKLLCGTGTSNRPADFFSQKSCAVQYGALLENVETPKRKKREHISGQASPVETPTDLILRRLTEERIQELKLEMKNDQEEYAKLSNDVKCLQSGELSDERVLEMWQEIEKQQEQQRIEEMKLENQLREREQRRQELQRNWRHSPGGVTAGTPPTVVLQKPQNVEVGGIVDMDVEEVIGTTVKPTVLGNITAAGNVHQQSGQTATSPLLSSLLKSPTSSTAPSLPTPVVTSNSARTSAPTITTLLTSGAIPNSNQPAIVLKKLPPEEAAELLARPISGPPTESLILPPSNSQNLLSPSQSAPTLSMLLEKNKNYPSVAASSPLAVTSSEETKSDNSNAKSNVTSSHTADFNNEEVPMDIEEDVATTSIAPNSSVGGATTMGGDSDETDPNEEQQLLEVFKNIGNIEELGIDVADVIEEVDFLKGVDEEPPPNEGTTESMDFEIKLETEPISTVSQKYSTTKNIEELDNKDIKDINASKFTKNEMKGEGTKSLETDDTKTIKGEFAEIKVPMSTKSVKVETSSSDDSNDNIPLAAVASLENKERNQTTDSAQERTFLKEKLDSESKNDKVHENDINETVPISEDIIKTEDIENAIDMNSEPDVISTNTTTPKKEKTLLNAEEKSPADSESSDVIVIQTDDDESNSEKQTQQENTEDMDDTVASKDIKSEKDEPIQIEEVKDIDDDDDEDIASNTAEVETSVAMLEEKSSELPVAHTPPESSCVDTKANLVPPQATISIADTDDSSTTDISVTTTSTIKREEKVSGTITYTVGRTPTQHQSRKSLQEAVGRIDNKTDEESTSTSSATPARPPLLRKLRDRDRSESPMIDDDNTTASDHYATSQRSRRRYSSTPVIDSIPSSPASSDRDERETRSSKKLLLSIFNALQHSKNAAIIQRAFTEDHNKYDDICLRQMDLQVIKKNIDSGITRNVNELQRDIMLMCQNAIMLFRCNTMSHKAALAFLQECQGIREFISNPTNDNSVKADKELKDSKFSGSNSSLNISGVKGRTASRKSQRIS